MKHAVAAGNLDMAPGSDEVVLRVISEFVGKEQRRLPVLRRLVTEGKSGAK
jgi:hypothetical protein